MRLSDKSAERYVKKISVNPEMSHNKILSRITKGSTVLEFGPASGVMTEVLSREYGCHVSIVEIDPVCFKEAMTFAEDGICTDIEKLEWLGKFQDRQFDYILFSDVLEHLREPEEVLRKAGKLLRPNGSILLSVPNIAHNSIIIQLLKNQFIYQSTGILDYTHVRHFTYAEIEKLCMDCGYSVIYMDGVYISVGKNEFDVSYGDIDPLFADMLKKRPFGEIYQHILEIKQKEYVIENDIKIQNCLTSSADFADLFYDEVDTDSQSSENDRDKMIQLLCNCPNRFFATNNEVARMRLEMNEMYAAQEELTHIMELRRRIYEYQEEVRIKNRHIEKLDSEAEKYSLQIVDLQKEIEERNDHIKKLDQTIASDTVLLQEQKNLQAELEEKNCSQEERLASQKRHIERLLETERAHKEEIQKYRQNAETLQQIIRNKEGHIELLLEVERAYEREKNSHSYKLMKRIQKTGDFFLPPDSRRRFFLRILYNMIRHPRLMFHVINIERIKNYLKYMRKEGMKGVKARYEEAVAIEDMQMNPEKRLDLEIEQNFPKNGENNNFHIEDFEKIIFPVFAIPKVSIIIPVYNEFEYTYNCLKSILKNSGDVPYEIIVADDCSSDLTVRVEEIAVNVKSVTTEKNVKFLLNCNHAAKYAKGDYILFLNNDTQVQANWLEPMVSLMERDKEAGLVGAKLVYPDGLLQEAGGIVWKDASAWNYGNRKSPEDPEFNYVKEADYISGACIMVRRTLWEEIGGFDERFAPAYYEDTDLAFEIRKRGCKVMYQPLSVVVHFEGVSNGTDVKSGLKQYQIVNHQKFYEKWKTVLEADHEINGENVFTAKDRSRHKKQILVVDHYVPHHDQDAGGKCTYMYLKLFVKFGLKVTFIGDNFFKHEPYTTELNQLGIEVLYGNYYYNHWENWLKENGHYFDYVYLQRPHISIKYIDLVRQYSNARILYFAHDLHHIREYREYEMTKDPEILASSQNWKKIEYDLFAKADVGHVVGSFEQEIMQKAFPDKPIRNIPLYIYEELPEDINKDFRTRKDLLYVGGFGHPPNIDAVLWFAQEVFPVIVKKYPDIIWHVVGGKVPKEVSALASENIIIEGFVSDADLEKLYRTCRMAVVPLRFGAGVKGKVVEAAYFQIPLVTTSIGAEGVSQEEHSMLVENDAGKMAGMICELYEDYERLQEISDNGKAFISRYFTLSEAERVIRLDMNV